MKNLENQITNFCQYLTVEKNLSPQTVINYRFQLRYFLKWLQQNDKDGFLSPKGSKTAISKIKGFRIHLASTKLSKKTQNYYLIALRSFFRWLSRYGKSPIMPEEIELLKVGQSQIK